MLLNILGSNTSLDFPSQIAKYFNGKHLVDIRNNSLMEMDALYLFLATFIDSPEIQPQAQSIRSQIVSGIYANLEVGNKFWVHNAWGKNEIHMRFTTSALRTLLLNLKLSKSHITTENDYFILLNKHLQYHDKLSEGKWFLHDSLELSDNYIDYYLPNNIFGSRSNNILVLNTHLDTLQLLIETIQSSTFREKKDQLVSILNSGIISLKKALDLPIHYSWSIDTKFRELFIRYPNSILLKKYFYRIRLHLKIKHPTFIFPDGYTEREISLAGINFEYHVINLWDMAKLLNRYHQCHQIQNELLNAFFEDLSKIIINGLRYIQNSKSYNKYIDGKNSAYKAIICEVIINLFQHYDPTPELITIYLKFRKKTLPTPTILAADPLCFTHKTPHISKLISDCQKLNLDVLPLSNGKILILNHSNENIKIPESIHEHIYRSSQFKTIGADDFLIIDSVVSSGQAVSR